LPRLLSVEGEQAYNPAGPLQGTVPTGVTFMSPGVDFQTLTTVCVQGSSSERAIAGWSWDSPSPRDFPGMELTETASDRSTFSLWRECKEVNAGR